MTRLNRMARPSIPLKHAVTLNPEVLPEDTSPDAEFAYIDIAALEGGSVELSPRSIRFQDAPSRARRVIRSGDTIISTVRTYLRAVANFRSVDEPLVASTGFAVLRPNGRLHPRCAYWAVLSDSFVENVVAHSEGVSYPAINPSTLGSLHVPMPSYSEQEAIANRLDEQTQRIDTLIRRKEALAKLVKEYAESKVSFLIAGKHLPGPRKKTGWPMLPDIPSEWALSNLRCVTTRVDVGIAEAATHAYADTGVPILRSTNVRPNRIQGQTLYIEEWFAQRNGSKTIRANDLVTVRTGYPGVTAVVPNELDGCQCFTMLISTLQPGCLPSFYSRYLNSTAARAYFDIESWGSAQKNISVPILKEIKVPRLSLEQQISIDSECARVDAHAAALLTHVERHIEKLRKYRRALITASVNGCVEQLAAGHGS